MLTEKAPLPDVSARDVLRTRTQKAHRELHKHSSFVGLFDQTLDLDDYRTLTRRLYGFYAPLDQAIERVLKHPRTHPYDYARRSGFLAQDMADMGLDDQEIRQTPICKHVFDLVTPSTLAGVLYVVEGATLGGSTIDRAAHKLLGQPQPQGRQFWAWCRSQNKTRWHMVNRYLEHLGPHDLATGLVAKGAEQTFQIFGDWLAPLDQRPLQ